ncbi:hypothetical protein [Peribacillus huizhouensis]|uniref:Holin n=1 Tax=Peribacillus huizhouensis TaxID=1501239 RepID=A0ABR6CJL8_9BACI|nr:hypothetical protein [Peribacillus huizhouensis]MBA9025210.1 hypothetical protein [Peribacillus huizhouensis]
MDFPTIHTNFWDGVIAVPVVIILTQLIKIFFHIPKQYVPTIAVIIGLLFSVLISHRHDLMAGIFMGFFYGNAAIGGYASLKNTLAYWRQKKAEQNSPE